jgi:RNA polymerase sigma-70 factor, ECF subfamily
LHEPEPDVVRRAQRGDADAFEDLVRAFLPDVYRMALHIVREPATADDVAQDTFVKAYRAIGRFAWRAKFSTWLFAIARNTAVEAKRTTTRRRRLDAPRDAPSPPDPSLRLALRTAIDSLPAELREAFLVIEVSGFSYPEASTILSVPVGTLKSRMYRARRLLIAELDEMEDAGEM